MRKECVERGTMKSGWGQTQGLTLELGGKGLTCKWVAKRLTWERAVGRKKVHRSVRSAKSE